MQLILLTALLASSISVNAAPPSIRCRAFTVNTRSRATDRRSYDGPSALIKALNKYGMPIPRTLHRRQTSAAANVTATDIALTEMNDLEYLSPVQVGNTQMLLDFDTGSSDLWVFSNQLPAGVTAGHAVYDVGAGSTGQQLQGSTWQIGYEDGSGAQGVVYADKVIVGGATATAQAVEAATSISTEFVSEDSDGLMGLGFGNLNTVKPKKQPTFFESIKSTLQQPVFTVSLKKNATGSYDFGFIDPSKFTGDIQYVPVNSSRGYWEFTHTGYAIGSSSSSSPSISSLTPVNFQAIADTGTTLMLLPSSLVTAYYAQVSGAASIADEGGYVFPCDSELPDLTLSMGAGAGTAAVATVPGELMNRSVSDTGSGLCYGGLQQGDEGLSIWGDVFLKSVFAVFDGSDGGPQLGFAPQATAAVGGASTPPPTTMTTTTATASAAASSTVASSRATAAGASSSAMSTAVTGDLPCEYDDCGSDQGFTFAHATGRR